MLKLPRKLKKKRKKEIPVGDYCYTPTSGFKELEEGRFGYTIKSCPFYKHIEGLEGHCSLLNCEVTDQIKEC